MKVFRAALDWCDGAYWSAAAAAARRLRVVGSRRCLGRRPASFESSLPALATLRTGNSVVCYRLLLPLVPSSGLAIRKIWSSLVTILFRFCFTWFICDGFTVSGVSVFGLAAFPVYLFDFVIDLIVASAQRGKYTWINIVIRWINTRKCGTPFSKQRSYSRIVFLVQRMFIKFTQTFRGLFQWLPLATAETPSTALQTAIKNRHLASRFIWQLCLVEDIVDKTLEDAACRQSHHLGGFFFYLIGQIGCNRVTRRCYDSKLEVVMTSISIAFHSTFSFSTAWTQRRTVEKRV